MDQIPYRLPLVIGATGHRDLREEDLPHLKRAVVEVIDRLRRDYLQGDSETPIIVLSSLAEGADRLIAQVALDLGARLIAPLPMPPDEYRRDFDPERRLKPDAAAKFERLKEQALATPVMPFAKGNTAQNVQEVSRRALQYREVGLFIVRHCHVLIALWNGDESNMAVGGTAEVVTFKRDGIPLDRAASVRASLDAPEMGPVIHIVTPRAKPGDKVTEIKTDQWGKEFGARYRAERRWWYSLTDFMATAFGEQPKKREFPDKREERKFESWEAFESKAGLTCRFNREAAELDASRDGTGQLHTSLSYLFDPGKDPAKELLSATAKARATQLIPHWCRIYQIADTLAQQRQKRFIGDWRILFALGFLAILCFEIGTHLLFDSHGLFVLLGFYGVFFLVTFGLFRFARRNQHQERFLDYRALAEASRVAVFWKLVGIGWPTGNSSSPRSTVDLDSTDAVADAYPIRQPSELDWVKTCLRTLELLDTDKNPADMNHRFDTDGNAWARTFWVDGQLEFFRRRGPQHDHHAEAFENRSLILVILSIVFAVLLLLIDVLFDTVFCCEARAIHWGHEYWLHRAAIFFIGLLPGLAAVWTGYVERLALKAQARQYDRMRVLFQRAQDLLKSPPPENPELIRVLYAELGREAMEENAEWVAIYRQRPIRPPN
jgi:hypothetical protein